MAGQSGVRLALVRAGVVTAPTLAARSAAGLDCPLSTPAELWVAVASDTATLLGAFQRAGPVDEAPLLRRGSGGPAVRVGPGTVHVALSLASPGALEPCSANRVVNRAVRPLLRALTKTGALAHYFGRDWVSVAHRPVAWVGFAHDSGTGRTLFDAFVAVRAPFAAGAGEARASFAGKLPATLEELAGRTVDPVALAEAIADAYLAKHGADEVEGAPFMDTAAAVSAVDPPWSATVNEAIGIVGAGPDADGRFRVGGDLLVSRDALADLEDRVVGASDAEVGAIVDGVLAAPGVAVDGIASLRSVRDAILGARALVRTG
jgi:hypothetical protein